MTTAVVGGHSDIGATQTAGFDNFSSTHSFSYIDRIWGGRQQHRNETINVGGF